MVLVKASQERTFGLALVIAASLASLAIVPPAHAGPLSIDTSSEHPFENEGLVGVSKDGLLAAFWLFDYGSAVFRAEKAAYAKKHDDIEPLSVDHLFVVELSTGNVLARFQAVHYEIPNFAVTNGYPDYNRPLAAEANQYLSERAFKSIATDSGRVKGKPGIRRLRVGPGRELVAIPEAETLKRLKATLTGRKKPRTPDRDR